MLSRTSKRALALVAAVVIYQATAAAYQPAVEDDCMDQCMANRENCRAQNGEITQDCTGLSWGSVCEYKLTCQLPN